MRMMESFFLSSQITFYITIHIKGRGRKEMSHNDHVALSDYLFSTMILDFFSSADLFVLLFALFSLT